jgi:hypothetical protein
MWEPAVRRSNRRLASDTNHPGGGQPCLIAGLDPPGAARLATREQPSLLTAGSHGGGGLQRLAVRGVYLEHQLCACGGRVLHAHGRPVAAGATQHQHQVAGTGAVHLVLGGR